MITISIIALTMIRRESKKIRTVIIVVLIITILIESRTSIESIEILAGILEKQKEKNMKMGIYIIILTIIIIRQKLEKTEEYIMYLFTILGMEILMSSKDLISGLIAIELQSIGIYIMNIKKSKRAISAGVKYYIIGSISSVILIIGIVTIYKMIGVTSIEGIRMNRESKGMMIIIIMSLLIKIGAAPFHNWVADVYNGLTTDRTIIISSIGKIGIIIYISKLIMISNINMIIVITLIMGSIGGLSEYRMKRIMGYSSISNIGWMLIDESRIYVYQYFISVIIIMMNIMNTKSSTSIIITMFSLAGIPPLIGFIGKLEVLYKTIISGEYIMTMILIITSVISTVYYLRIIINIKKVKEKGKKTIMTSIMTIYQMVYIII